MSAAEPLRKQLDRLQQRSLAIGAAASLACVFGAYFDPGQFFRSYLVAYIFWCGIAVGCLGFLMLHHLVGGRWGFVIQRPLESAIRTLPLLALLFLPVLLGMQELYLWARPEAAADELLRQKSPYLNGPFFIARALAYLAIWIGIGHFLTRWSLEQDRGADRTLTRRLQLLSGPGLVLYGLTVTFSSIDWMMSLEPKWFSTMYGMMFMVLYPLTALSFIVAIAFLLAGREPLSRVISPDRFHDLGNLLLALVMLWAYLAFSQFLIVWSENLVEEIPWYLRRTAGGWGAVAVALILFQFGLPFLLLLSRGTKRGAATLATVASVVLLMCWINLFWLIAPAFYPGKLQIHWLDLLTPVGIGGIWLAVFFRHLKRPSLLPLHDPRFAGPAGEMQGA
ncbi:MAG: hypothetical protein ACREP8_17555 [Candidatus Binatia bacterium]